MLCDDLPEVCHLLEHLGEQLWGLRVVQLELELQGLQQVVLDVLNGLHIQQAWAIWEKWKDKRLCQRFSGLALRPQQLQATPSPSQRWDPVLKLPGSCSRPHLPVSLPYFLSWHGGRLCSLWVRLKDGIERQSTSCSGLTAPCDTIRSILSPTQGLFWQHASLLRNGISNLCSSWLIFS